MKVLKLLVGAACLAAAGIAGAAFPERPVRIIVPYPPGGNIDITARTIAPGMSEALGVQVVIDNRGGAGGTIGSEIAAKAAPDGYTTLLGSTGTLATSPLLYAKLGFHPLKDYAYPQEFEKVLRAEITKWSKVVREANVKVE